MPLIIVDFEFSVDKFVLEKKSKASLERKNSKSKLKIFHGKNYKNL